jgi:hypothetical protein
MLHRTTKRTQLAYLVVASTGDGVEGLFHEISPCCAILLFNELVIEYEHPCIFMLTPTHLCRQGMG